MRAIKNIRLKNYDYSANGYYFVTIVTNFRQRYLKDLHDLVKEAIENLNHLDGVTVDYYTVMDNHIHIIIVLEECQYKLGEIIRRLKAVTSRKAGFKLWQPNYYEHVIRNDKALKKIREYIVNNPVAELIEFKQFYADS